MNQTQSKRAPTNFPSQTIVFVHGAWLTPDAWDDWRKFFADHGFKTFAPPWPYMDRPIHDLRASPDPRLARLTVSDIADHYESFIRTLPEKPILIGHSFGGLIIQLLLDRGLAAAGVALDPAPPKGVIPGLTALRSAAPILTTWNGWNRILTMNFRAFSKTFANAFSKGIQEEAYHSHIVPAPGRIFFQAALGIGVAIKYKNPDRAPLLLIVGGKDRTVDPVTVRRNYRAQKKSTAPTEFHMFKGRSHFLFAEPAWEEIADFVAEWIGKY